MSSRSNLCVISGGAPVARPQPKVTRAVIANRYLSKMSPETRREILAESKVKGAVQTAKDRALTVSAVLELRIQDLERVVREARERIAAMERGMAA